MGASIYVCILSIITSVFYKLGHLENSLQGKYGAFFKISSSNFEMSINKLMQNAHVSVQYYPVLIYQNKM